MLFQFQRYMCLTKQDVQDVPPVSLLYKPTRQDLHVASDV